MTATDKISVVIPCFNAERYIVAAVASVLAQAWPNLEVVVVDDGSSDGSAEAVRTVYPSMAFPGVTVLQQANRGVAAARNLGIHHSTGEWIAFLDADDIWLPGKLRAQIDLLRSHPEARMAYSAWQVWQSDEPAPTDSEAWLAAPGDEARWAGPSGWIYPQLLLDCEVWTSTVIARRSLFDEIGVFDTTFRVGEDYDFWLRASRVTPIVRVQRPFALYRIHPHSITHSVPSINYREKVILKAIEKWGYSSTYSKVAKKPDVRQHLARSWTDFAGAQLAAGNIKAAAKAGGHAILLSPGYLTSWKLLFKVLVQSFSKLLREKI